MAPPPRRTDELVERGSREPQQARWPETRLQDISENKNPLTKPVLIGGECGGERKWRPGSLYIGGVRDTLTEGAEHETSDGFAAGDGELAVRNDSR